MGPWRKGTTADQEATETYPERVECKEPTTEEMKSVAEQEKVPKEEAAVKSSGALKTRHRGRQLAAGRRGQPGKEPGETEDPRKKLAAAGRKMTRRTGVARSKVHVVMNNQTTDKAGRGTSKRRTFGRRCQPKPERKIGIKD
jgi:hypothetical protein